MEEQRKKELLEKFEKEIASDASPVGIDAKKTHMMILLKLEELQEEINSLKKKIEDA